MMYIGLDVVTATDYSGEVVAADVCGYSCRGDTREQSDVAEQAAKAAVEAARKVLTGHRWGNHQIFSK